MLIRRDLAALRRAIVDLRDQGRQRRRRLALVPTMGALHDGHIALVRAARQAADIVAVSIFVNPLQFGAAEDLARYPSDEEGDLAKLRQAGCDLVWLPAAPVMYPPGSATVIEVGGPSEGWEGAHRPGHFRGVATVCAKLFLQTAADVAVFGEKDWQQLQVVRRMARDLDLPVGILGVPTVRDADGLALSSRNRFLSPEERARAARFPATLTRTASALGGGGGAPPGPTLGEAEAALRADGFAVDYLALVEAETLHPLDALPGDRPARLIAAVRLGNVRLLDNIEVVRT